MLYSVEAYSESGILKSVTEAMDEDEAAQLAEEEATEPGEVYITWSRESDGQRGYLNRTEHSPIGEPW
jgi:hypothetical protein